LVSLFVGGFAAAFGVFSRFILLRKGSQVLPIDALQYD
jgi:hypothetical protein